MNIDIYQSEKVTDRFGYWPMFCDSKIRYFSIDTFKKSINLMLFYIDSDKNISASIGLDFQSVLNVELSDFLDENVIDELSIKVEGSRYLVEIFGCYGLHGSFSCDTVRVNSTEINPKK